MDIAHVKVLFFAKARELIGKSQDYISLQQGRLTGKVLIEFIVNNYPSLEPLTSSIVLAVDQEYVQPEDLLIITSSTEIAIIPPLSGG